MSSPDEVEKNSGNFFRTSAFSFFLSDPFIWVLDLTRNGLANILTMANSDSDFSLIKQIINKLGRLREN